MSSCGYREVDLSFAKSLAGSKIVDRRAVAGHFTGDVCRHWAGRCASVSAVGAQRPRASGFAPPGKCPRSFRSALSSPDRRFWLCLRWLWPRWREALVLVQPATVERWRREGLRLCWSRRSGRQPGRPRVDTEVRALIRRMAAENHLWGAPRIHGELLKLGIAVSERTVSRYLASTRRAPSQTWRTFLLNHFGQLTFTSPPIVCDAADDDHALDISEVLPRPASVSREPSSVSNQWSIVHWRLSLQCVPIDGLIGQAHVQHRKREHPRSGRDPPKPRQSKCDPSVYRAPSVRSLHEAVGTSNTSAPLPRTDAGRLVTLRSITWPASSQPCDMLHVKRCEAHTCRVILTAAGVLATHSPRGRRARIRSDRAADDGTLYTLPFGVCPDSDWAHRRVTCSSLQNAAERAYPSGGWLGSHCY